MFFTLIFHIENIYIYIYFPLETEVKTTTKCDLQKNENYLEFSSGFIMCSVCWMPWLEVGGVVMLMQSNPRSSKRTSVEKLSPPKGRNDPRTI